MRTFIDILKEQWDNTVSAYDFTSNPIHVDIFRNPSRAEVAKLVKSSKENVLRGLLDGDDLLVWDAYLTTHGDVQKHYPNARSIYLLLHPDRLEWNDIQYENNEGDDHAEYPFGFHLRASLAYLYQNASLNHIYGQGFVCIGLDHDVGEQHAMTPEWIEANCSPSQLS